MPFSNVWDQTFPPDTQQASLGGSDLRLLRVDTQQRMAAISGLDASKPAFGSDAQPAAWNGILFFATDTGKIYQWNNPSWTDVTSSFKPTGGISTVRQVGSDFTTTSTTLVNWLTLVNMTANTTYSIDAHITWTNGGFGIGVSLTGPASPTNVFLWAEGASGVAAGAYQYAGAGSGYGPVAAVNTSVGNVLAFNFYATVENGANAGNLIIQVQANGGGTLTIKRGSYCSIRT